MTRGNLAFLGATVAGVVLLFVVGLLRPHLLVEDGFVETSSAVGYAIASLLALIVTFGRRTLLTAWDKGVLIGTSALCLLLSLSEVSFGARLFGLKMPELYGGGEFDGGHDIVIVVVRYVGTAGAGLLAATLLAAIALGVLWAFRRQALAIGRRILSSSFEFRLSLGLVMLATAVVLDLLTGRRAAALEEVLEFSASVVLIAAVFAVFRREAEPTAFGAAPKQHAPWGRSLG